MMLRKCLPLLHVVMRSSLIQSSVELHRLLDTMNHSSADASHKLKLFLQKDLIPLLEGTSLDSKHDMKEMQQKACQILQKAAFSAQLLQASPEKRFVRTLLDCILHDHERMHFLHRMTSAQASKIIASLCSVGVRDRSVYAVLIPKLDFHSLEEIASVMFAFVESGLHDLTIRSIVPLYRNEKWTLSFESRQGDRTASRDAKAGDLCNVFEAVRVLRALSTSIRAMLYSKRSTLPVASDAAPSRSPSGGDEDLPYVAINKIRNRICLFILENDSVMRGAHWINFVRALVNFPKEYQVLDGLKEDPQFTRVIGKFASDIARDQAVESAGECAGGRILENGPATGYDLALIGMARIFDFAEGKRSGYGDKATLGKERASFDKNSSGRAIVENIPFDCGLLDLIKLLPLLSQVPSAKPKQESRFRIVLQTLQNHATRFHFGDFVRLLNVLRTLGTTFNTKDAIREIIHEAERKLVAISTQKREVARIPAASVLSFATILCELHIKECYGFVQFITQAAPILPARMSPDEVSTCLSAIALNAKDSSEMTKSIVRILLGKLRKHLNARGGEANGSSSSLPILLVEYPTQCVSILHAMTLLEVLPEEKELRYFLASPSDEGLSTVGMTSTLRNAGAVVLLDFSRAIANLGRIAVSREKGELVARLWRLGVLHTLLPLLTQHTEELADRNRGAIARSSSSTPIAWSNAMKTVFFYMDFKVDTVTFEMMATRLGEVYAATKKLAVQILRCAEAELSSSRYGTSHHSAEENQRSGQVSLSPSVMVHMLTYMLIWEFMLFEGSWSAKQRLLVPDVPGADKDVADRLLELKEEYIKFLDAPLSENSIEVKKTPMEIIQRVFGITTTGISETPPIEGVPLLTKSHILDLTNNLPFVISLALNPGPINEFFSEHSGSLIVNEYKERD
ncbi:unnamed protein product [Phytomonas sp. EM1]|nr:unnamed protein product [Phytomonas sp. EM1]|eukprot:CCW60990.1 unnamed protein product [Phytomonas sp. isolate EM1]